MAAAAEVLDANRANYESLYSQRQAFLRYPADWIIRFHNMYLKKHLPTGRVLDYGCGSANNTLFFLENGYDAHGVDVAPSALELIRENLAQRGYADSHNQRFHLVEPGSARLPFPDASFDLIVSNQVLYYLPTREHIQAVCSELARCLRPGGLVFFTMMGPQNYYITHHTRSVHGEVYECVIDQPGHRLNGVRELIYLVRDEDHLQDLFGQFECVTWGYFDQRMFDLRSNFHWIFVGRNGAKPEVRLS